MDYDEQDHVDSSRGDTTGMRRLLGVTANYRTALAALIPGEMLYAHCVRDDCIEAVPVPCEKVFNSLVNDHNVIDGPIFSFALYAYSTEP